MVFMLEALALDVFLISLALKAFEAFEVFPLTAFMLKVF
jgi:hypothetical protein